MDTPMISSDIDVPADIAATLVDPTAYADRRIHDAYRWLRVNNSLGVARPEGHAPFWVVAKHAHIAAISRQNELFHNADRPTTLMSVAFEERVRQITGGPNLVRSLVQMDAPDHPKYRALTQGWFMPANLGKFEPRVREIKRYGDARHSIRREPFFRQPHVRTERQTAALEFAVQVADVAFDRRALDGELKITEAHPQQLRVGHSHPRAHLVARSGARGRPRARNG